MFHCLPNSAWADWNLAEAAVQLGKMVEHPNQSQPNPGLRADESPCRWIPLKQGPKLRPGPEVEVKERKVRDTGLVEPGLRPIFKSLSGSEPFLRHLLYLTYSTLHDCSLDTVLALVRRPHFVVQSRPWWSGGHSLSKTEDNLNQTEHSPRRVVCD